MEEQYNYDNHQRQQGAFYVTDGKYLVVFSA